MDFTGKSKEEIEAFIADARSALDEQDKAAAAARQAGHAAEIIKHRQAIRSSLVWLHEHDAELPRYWREIDLKSLPRVTSRLKHSAGIAEKADEPKAVQQEAPAPAKKRGRKSTKVRQAEEAA